jgi:hypothetical protein
LEVDLSRSHPYLIRSDKGKKFRVTRACLTRTPAIEIEESDSESLPMDQPLQPHPRLKPEPTPYHSTTSHHSASS